MKSLNDYFFETAFASFEPRSPFYEFGFREFEPPASTEGTTPTDPDFADLPFDGLTGFSHPGAAREEKATESLDELPFISGVAKTVICVDALERTRDPRRAVSEMVRILAPEGLLFIGVRLPRRWPPKRDLRFWLTPQTMQRLLADLDATVIAWYGNGPVLRELAAVGFKGRFTNEIAMRFSHFLKQMNEFQCPRRFGPGRLLRWLLGMVRGEKPSTCNEMLHMAVHMPASALLHSPWFNTSPGGLGKRVKENGSAGSNGLHR